MLFNLTEDPHEQHNLAGVEPQIAAEGQRRLGQWQEQMMATATTPQDPMKTVLAEGGPLHSQIDLPAYLERLRQTGRSAWADRLTDRYGQ